MFAKCRIAFRAHTKSYPVYHERLSDSPLYRWAWRAFAPPIPQKSPFLCGNSSPIRYDKSYRVNITFINLVCS